MSLTVTHDNGNMVCFSDGSTWVRQEQALHAADGTVDAAVSALIGALDSHVLRQGGLI
jgi:hypothetical protein